MGLLLPQTVYLLDCLATKSNACKEPPAAARKGTEGMEVMAANGGHATTHQTSKARNSGVRALLEAARRGSWGSEGMAADRGA